MFKFNFVTPEDDSNYAESIPRDCNLSEERNCKKCKITLSEELGSIQREYLIITPAEHLIIITAEYLIITKRNVL